MVLPENKEERELHNKDDDLPENQLDWRHVMPCRKAVRDYIYDAAILNFQYIAEYLMESNTVKLAGRKAFDIKTSVVTVVNQSEEGKAKIIKKILRVDAAESWCCY